MKTKLLRIHPHSRALLVFIALLEGLAWSPQLRAAPAGTALPAGVVEFGGRLARHHWYLFGPDQRSHLEDLNRDLREAQQQLQRGGDDDVVRAARQRAAAATSRLLALVTNCPGLLRVDLSTARPMLVPAGPVELPGDTGALLIASSNGGEGIQFGTDVSDMSLPPGESSLVTVEVAARGTTYALAGLEHVPFGRTMLTVELRQPGQSSIRLPLEVQVPSPGRLKLSILSEESGQPAPAMVRLMWRTDGLVRQPGNGIEFAAQFDKQGTPSGARSANLPGSSSGQFWCVPGPVDMTLAPGVWQIGVRRGVEHEVILEDVTIQSSQTVEKTIRPRRWVDMRQQGWWSGDDHVHCRILSDEDARHLMAWVQAEDIHLANVVKMGDIYRTYFEQRGFGPQFRVAEGQFVLVPGQECPRTHDQIGHTLAMNITSLIRNPERYFLYDEVFDAVHAQGGLSGYAHVNSGNFHVHRDMSMNVPKQKLDFVEILQFNQLGTDLYYDFLNLGCKLTASAGSDVPWGGTVGEVRAYAYLGDKSFSADNWFEAFGRGRTFTTSGPMIAFQVEEALPGDELLLDQDRSLRVHARAWGDPKRMAPVKLEIIRHGTVIKSAQSEDPARPQVDLDFTVQAEHGFWIAARAWAGDGTSAHTTPVYVVRKGLRFWKFDELESLIRKRIASLGEIEEIVSNARRLDAEGKLGTDRYRTQLARQGDLLLERVSSARRLYDDLRRTAAAERQLRTTATR